MIKDSNTVAKNF